MRHNIWLLSTAAFTVLGSSAFGAIRTWDGEGADGSFSNPVNWDGNTTIPSTGDDLQLSAVLAGPSLFGLDTAGTFNASSLTFLSNAPAYTLTATTTEEILNLTRASALGAAMLNSSANRQNFTFIAVNVGTATQTWDGGAGGLSLFAVNLGNNRTLTIIGSATGEANRNEIKSGIDGTGTSGIVKAGAGALFLAASSNNSYTGATRIAGGSLVLGGSAKVPDVSNLIMEGGTFDLAGFDEKTGKLSLTATSTIDFGITNTSDLALDASNLENWGAFSLNITNFNTGQDTLRFGTSSSGLTSAQLAQINFGGVAGAQIDNNGFVTPIPEPSTAALLACTMIGLAGFRRHRA